MTLTWPVDMAAINVNYYFSILFPIVGVNQDEQWPIKWNERQTIQVVWLLHMPLMRNESQTWISSKYGFGSFWVCMITLFNTHFSHFKHTYKYFNTLYLLIRISKTSKILYPNLVTKRALYFHKIVKCNRFFGMFGEWVQIHIFTF